MRFPLSLARKIISAYRLDESVDTRLVPSIRYSTVRYIIWLHEMDSVTSYFRQLH